MEATSEPAKPNYTPSDAKLIKSISDCPLEQNKSYLFWWGKHFSIYFYFTTKYIKSCFQDVGSMLDS